MEFFPSPVAGYCVCDYLSDEDSCEELDETIDLEGFNGLGISSMSTAAIPGRVGSAGV